MLLDNLETLRFFSLKDSGLVTVESFPVDRNGSSSVSFLDLGTIHFSTAALFSIIKLPKGLKRLRTTIAGFVELPNPYQLYSIQGPGVAFSPQTMESILASTKDSLEALEIVPDQHFWPPHDGTQLNLRDFSSLKQVIVPSDCFWPSNLNGNWKSHGDRNGVYLLLPESLVELEILFSIYNSIWAPDMAVLQEVLHAPRYPSNATGFGERSGPDALTLRDCSWLEEFAINKSRGNFSSLRSISLIEQHGKVIWTNVPCISAAFEEAGILLCAKVRSSGYIPGSRSAARDDLDYALFLLRSLVLS